MFKTKNILKKIINILVSKHKIQSFINTMSVLLLGKRNTKFKIKSQGGAIHLSPIYILSI